MGDELEMRMSSARLEDLVAIAESRPADGFELDVIAAARRELAAREVDSAVLSEVRRNHEGLQSEEDGRPKIALSHPAWIFFAAIGPVLILSIPLALSLLAQGYKQKGKDAFGGILAGFLIWGIGIPVILFALSWLGIA
ncbi:hypothetical protein [Erythrobacter sp. SG61-1L]|uniref:hypothetical protein n=1 Tax=Erythrobacter sp. SG61-1L TaxID=1603897 RepID=UPI000A4E7A5C|nr:hypothetical protein [Erythrobacter sp. SG61-1L]